jgi:hypothetical protein
VPESRMLPQPGRRVRWTWSSPHYTCTRTKLLESILANSLFRYWNRALDSEKILMSYRITVMTDDRMGRPFYGLSDKKKDAFYTCIV